MFRNIQVEPCEFFGSAGINEDILRKSMDRMEEVPFDSDRKLMSTKYSLNGVSTILTKESDEPLSVDTEYNFIFPGLISMVNPPRPESVEAVADAKKAGGQRLLDEKPRDPKAGIMTRDFVMTMIAEGTLIAVVTMTAYHIGIAFSPAMASTMAFAAGVCLLALVIFVPFLHSVFSVENLSATAIAQTIGLSFIPTVIIQLIKVCRNKKEK